MILFLCLSFCVSAHHLCQLLSVGICTAARVEAEQRGGGGGGGGGGHSPADLCDGTPIQQPC